MGEIALRITDTHNIHKRAKLKKAKYVIPTVKEICAVMPFDGDSYSRDLSLKWRGKDQTQCISNLSPMYDPLAYVFMFPYATPQYEIGMPQRLDGGDHPIHLKRHNMTIMQHTRFRLFHRDEEKYNFNPILYCGRLFLRYIVDMYIKMENSNLHFFRMNQKIEGQRKEII
jgi:hypothetical protein